jgi:hypothetical protein
MPIGTKAWITIAVIFAVVVVLFTVIFLLTNSSSSTTNIPTTTEGKELLEKQRADAATLDGEMSEDELDFDF